MSLELEPIQYRPTAYDSTRPRDLPPLDEHLLRQQKSLRRWPVKGRGIQCREFLPNSSASLLVDDLKRMTEKKMKDLREEDDLPLILEWGSLLNPVLIIDVLWKFFAAFSVAGVVMSVVLGFQVGFYKFFSQSIVWIIYPALMAALGRTSLKRGWIKSRNNTRFERATGMVEFTANWKRVRLPFDEFDAYISEGVGRNGIAHYYLRLIHRYSAYVVTNPYYRYEPWDVEQEWEELQQFMDVSKPLPDIPVWELARLIDPASIEYDRKHARPERFWKYPDVEQVRKWEAASHEAVKRYPWGLTHEEALSVGWQPSGVGEGECIWMQWPMKDGRRVPPEEETDARQAATA